MFGKLAVSIIAITTAIDAQTYNQDQAQCNKIIFGSDPSGGSGGFDTLVTSTKWFYQTLLLHQNNSNLVIGDNYKQAIEDKLDAYLQGVKEEKGGVVSYKKYCDKVYPGKWSGRDENWPVITWIVKNIKWKMDESIFGFLEPAMDRGVIKITGQDLASSKVMWTQRGLDALNRIKDNAVEDWIKNPFEPEKLPWVQGLVKEFNLQY